MQNVWRAFVCRKVENGGWTATTPGPIAHAACWYDCLGNAERQGTAGSWIDRRDAQSVVKLAKWIASHHDKRFTGILSAFSGPAKLILRMIGEAGLL